MTSLVNGHNLDGTAALKDIVPLWYTASHTIRESMRAKNTDPILRVILVDVKYATLLDLALTTLSYFDM